MCNLEKNKVHGMNIWKVTQRLKGYKCNFFRIQKLKTSRSHFFIFLKTQTHEKEIDSIYLLKCQIFARKSFCENQFFNLMKPCQFIWKRKTDNKFLNPGMLVGYESFTVLKSKKFQK